MTTITMKSEAARNSWRDMLDIALTGGRVIIERYRKPQAILIGYEQWQKTQARLNELELLNEVRSVKQKVMDDKTETITHEELKRLMLLKNQENFVE